MEWDLDLSQNAINTFYHINLRVWLTLLFILYLGKIYSIFSEKYMCSIVPCLFRCKTNLKRFQFISKIDFFLRKIWKKNFFAENTIAIVLCTMHTWWQVHSDTARADFFWQSRSGNLHFEFHLMLTIENE